MNRYALLLLTTLIAISPPGPIQAAGHHGIGRSRASNTSPGSAATLGYPVAGSTLQNTQSRVQVHPIDKAGEPLAAVRSLAHDAYVGQGYIAPEPSGRLSLNSKFDDNPETTVMVASLEKSADAERIVATLSWTLDGPAGLPMDSDFGPQINQIRSEGRSVAGIWRLAADPEFRKDIRVIGRLFDETLQRILDSKADTTIFEVHPRHVRFYSRQYAAAVVAKKPGSVEGLRNAPGVLLRVNHEQLSGKRPKKTEHTPTPSP